MATTAEAISPQIPLWYDNSDRNDRDFILFLLSKGLETFKTSHKCGEIASYAATMIAIFTTLYIVVVIGAGTGSHRSV